jgi:MinD superfamily P-loop ATPase
VRNEAKRIAADHGHPWLIVDGSPGIGCPVIASIAGADIVLIVTEPTVSGEHDLERVADLTKHFGIRAAVCVNKFDLNPAITEQIKRNAERRGLFYAGTVRYDKAVTAAQVARAAVVEHTDLPVAQDIRSVWNRMVEILDGRNA